MQSCAGAVQLLLISVIVTCRAPPCVPWGSSFPWCHAPSTESRGAAAFSARPSSHWCLVFLIGRQYWCRCIQNICCQDSAFSYKELGSVLVGPFFIIFQLTWESGEVPVEWKLADVVPFGRKEILVIAGLLVSLQGLVKLVWCLSVRTSALGCDERKVTRNGERPQGQDSGGVAEHVLVSLERAEKDLTGVYRFLGGQWNRAAYLLFQVTSNRMWGKEWSCLRGSWGWTFGKYSLLRR